MAKKETKTPDQGAKIGRPKKVIPRSSFEEMCKIQCTREEICDVLGVSDKTLDKWCWDTYGEAFSAIFAEKRAGGKRSLRRAQYQAATIDRNPTALIWLGKQYLGQRDPDKIQKGETGNEDGVQIINDIKGEDG